jgi:nicotinate-nucleotide adenylyltransferase
VRIALFGGAFDPVHNAHLRIAHAAACEFKLNRVLFVPAAHPPHKSLSAGYEGRYRMVEIACQGEPAFEASRLEAGTVHSYSIETLEKLRPTLNANDELFFLIGADAFAEIQTWHRWRDVVESVEFIVVSRPGCEYAAVEGARIYRLDSLDLPVSSSEIRRKLAAGEEPVEVPPAVLRYIREHGLYR